MPWASPHEEGKGGKNNDSWLLAPLVTYIWGELHTVSQKVLGRVEPPLLRVVAMPARSVGFPSSFLVFLPQPSSCFLGPPLSLGPPRRSKY